MWDALKTWCRRKFSDPNANTLLLLVIVGVLLIVFFGGLLAPILVAVALAYLLEWPVLRLMQVGIPRFSAVVITFTLFIGVAIALMLFLVPVVWQQSVNLIAELPDMFADLQVWLHKLPEMFPGFVDQGQINELLLAVKRRVMGLGEGILKSSLSSLVSVMALLVYLIVVPLLLFFMLKDRAVLLRHMSYLLPKNRQLIAQVGSEMNIQIMNYIRGKALEVAVVGVATFIVLISFDLRYAALLSVLVGLSVLIPYIGAAVVTLPVVLVALFQFGLTSDFVYVVLAYLVVQALDGNLLVPLLFSEAVNLNPVYIIAAVILFGGIWGFWGVFFAIPLASLVKAIITAWAGRALPVDSGAVN
ncbi:AI-2E family transporter [Idiomarina tyrosinivorans]|uniref:AI-2E family transporter n=1 Tax=Idiomarina tyrosinivorans TaxID=1445662 RepID=A0A432ZU74_9GAMM|nr:AI-2E family transporter [Idiomarina tyrosinivorans]RUO81467.1 AI-2E family transporter [Idiomarina tyrosinivorans]